MKRVMPFLLVLALLLTVLPVTAFADTGGEQQPSSEGIPSDAGGQPPGTMDPPDEDPPEDGVNNPTGDGGEEEPAPAGEDPLDTAPPDPQVEAATVWQATRLRAGLPTVATENEIDLADPQPVAGTSQWELNGSAVLLTGPGPFHISGTGGTTTRIAVDYTDDPVVVILKDVKLTNNDSGYALFDCGDAEVVMWLEGESVLSLRLGTGMIGPAALRCAGGASLTIQGNGTLTATGVDFGAGIGGNHGEDAGDITIAGNAKVFANGGPNAAGIGGGYNGNGGRVKIEGNAQVTARGDVGADIGSGYGGTDGGTLEVTGGRLTLKDSGTDADATFKDCVLDGPGAGVHVGTYDSDGIRTGESVIEINKLAAPGATGPGWEYDASDSLVTILTSGSYRIVGNGTPTGNRVAINPNLTVTVTLENVVMEVPIDCPAFDIGADSDVELSLVGQSEIAHAFVDRYTVSDCAVVHVPEGATLVINSTVNGSLTASTSGSGAAIGGGRNGSGGNITIQGGTVNAISSGYGAAIGGGRDGNGGNITIEGGTVNATTSSYGAAIGGGSYGDNGGIIKIEGGTVIATTTNYAAAIGGGHGKLAGAGGGDSGEITISGGTVIANASSFGAAIGGGYYGNSTVITIEGDARVTATAEMNSTGAAIGGGRAGSDGYGGAGGTIAIEGNVQVTATSFQGASIGGGYGGDGADVTIAGGHTTATYIGKGTNNSNGSTGTVKITGGSLVLINLGHPNMDLSTFTDGTNRVYPLPVEVSHNSAPVGNLPLSVDTYRADTDGNGKATIWLLPDDHTLEQGDTDLWPGSTDITVGADYNNPKFEWTLYDLLSLTGGTLPSATVDQNYTYTFAATGGSGSGYTYTLSSGTLPSGLTLDNGALTGSPTGTGSFPFSVQVKDSAGQTATAAFDLRVSDAPPTTFAIAVNRGTATVGGATVTEAQQGVTVTIAADAAPSGQVFDRWTVNSGAVTLADAEASTTTFQMPGEAVRITATYKTDGGNTAYTLDIQSGKATVGGATVTEAQAGVTVTIAADAALAGQVFDRWIVNSGAVTLTDAEASTTTFQMPGEAVRITATYKTDGGSGGTATRDRRPPTSDGSASGAVTFSGVPTGPISVGGSFTVTPNYDDRTGSAGWTWDRDMFSATFNSPATFTALKEGTSTITYTTSSGVKSSFTVTVGAAAAAADPAAPAPDTTGSGEDSTEAVKPMPNTGARVSKPGARSTKRG